MLWVASLLALGVDKLVILKVGRYGLTILDYHKDGEHTVGTGELNFLKV